MTAKKFEPKFGAIIPATGPGFEGAPKADVPYYVPYAEGLFVKKSSLIGHGLAKVGKWPAATLPKAGTTTGYYEFDSNNRIPAKLMGQVVDFFERIYDRQHTEAEIMLVMHRDTKEWRVFVPTQLVSHGGVNYVFDPAHIQSPWFLVGSIHSHCNFGASPSSTDTGDASEFDGIHMVIGHIKDDIPEITAMASMNGQMMHFDKDQLDGIFDFSEPKQHKAPDWWDRYVEDTVNKQKPVGFELYKKFDKKTIVGDETKKTPMLQPGPGYKPSGYHPDNYVWDEDAGRMVWLNEHRVGKGQDGLRHVGNSGPRELASINGFRRFLSGVRTYCFTPDEINQAKAADNIIFWLDGLDWQELKDLGYKYSSVLQGYVWEESIGHPDTTPSPQWGSEGELISSRRPTIWGGDSWDGDWEDILDNPTLSDAIYESDFLTADESDYIAENREIAGNESFWRGLAMRHLTDAQRVLKVLGIDTTISITSMTEAKKPEPKQIKTPTTITPVPKAEQKGAN